jgi:5'-deoxynucleotidase YfbR-like HD superfamily hydrolase
MSKSKLTIKNASRILDTLSEFHLGSEQVYRFVGYPHVDGDNIAEHTSRAIRLAIYTMPFILEEFNDHPERVNLAENIYATILTHDDEEIAQGFDIISPFKNHNANTQGEIDLVDKKMKNLPDVSRKYVINFFTSFRKRDTLASRIAKACDNIGGNQPVLEQKLGLVPPDSARFALEFVEKVRGTSKTTDLLIDAHIKDIFDYRKFAKNSEAEQKILIDKAFQQEGCNLSRNTLKILINQLLDIDISLYSMDKNKVTLKLWEYL